MADLTQRAPVGEVPAPDPADVQRIQELSVTERPQAIGELGRTMLGIAPDTPIEEVAHPDRQDVFKTMRAIRRQVYPDLTGQA
jgi:hypothetical protein